MDPSKAVQCARGNYQLALAQQEVADLDWKISLAPSDPHVTPAQQMAMVSRRMDLNRTIGAIKSAPWFAGCAP